MTTAADHSPSLRGVPLAIASTRIFPGRARIVHRGFDDPPRLAATAKSPEEALRHYVRVRDEIKAFTTLDIGARKPS